MKRAEIIELFPEAPKEAIDKLMAINGADVNAAKAEMDSLRQQLSEAQNGAQLQQANQQIDQLKQELAGMKAAETIRLMREKVADEKQIPVNLLTGETEEACAAQADAILAFSAQAGKPAYPQIRDGGDPHNQPNLATRDRFADWAKDNL